MDSCSSYGACTVGTVGEASLETKRHIYMSAGGNFFIEVPRILPYNPHVTIPPGSEIPVPIKEHTQELANQPQKGNYHIIFISHHVQVSSVLINSTPADASTLYKAATDCGLLSTSHL